MIDQPNLFCDKICDYCKKNPGYKLDNQLLWNGFFDNDTKHHVCWNCRDLHYQEKEKTEYKYQYTEFPVYAIG